MCVLVGPRRPGSSDEPDPRALAAPHPALARHTAYLAIEVAAALRSAVDAELRELGLTWADFMVLAVVSALDGPSQEAIHNRVAVDRGSLSRLVRDLEYEGLIERYRGRPDGRRVHCSATPTGVAVADQAARAVDDAARRRSACCTPGSAADFTYCLGVL